MKSITKYIILKNLSVLLLKVVKLWNDNCVTVQRIFIIGCYWQWSLSTASICKVGFIYSLNYIYCTTVSCFTSCSVNKPSAQGLQSVCASFWHNFSCPFCRPSLLYGTHLPLPMSTRLGFQPVQPYLDKTSSSQF